MADTKLIVGILSILLMTGLVYITFSNELKLRIDNDKSTFYVKEGSYWVVAGREYNYLFDGSSRMNRDLSTINVTTIINGMETTVIRTTGYQRGPVVKDIYMFKGDVYEKESFPISHKIEVYNASGKFYRYEVRDLTYTGAKLKLTQTSMSFGKNMKVEWQPGFRWAWVYSNGVLRIQYDIPSDYETYDVRLFDPSAYVDLWLNGNNSNMNYELGTPIEIRFNSSSTTNITLDISNPEFGIGYNSTLAGNKIINISPTYLYYTMFQGGGMVSTVSNTKSLINLSSKNTSYIKLLKVNLTGSGNVENITLDIGNDGTIDYFLPGKLNDNYHVIDEFSNGSSNYSFYYPTTTTTKLLYFLFPNSFYFYNMILKMQGNSVSGDKTLSFSDTTYRNPTTSELLWNTTGGELVMTPEYFPFKRVTYTGDYTPTVTYPGSPFPEAGYSDNTSSTLTVFAYPLVTNTGSKVSNIEMRVGGFTNHSKLYLNWMPYLYYEYSPGEIGFAAIDLVVNVGGTDYYLNQYMIDSGDGSSPVEYTTEETYTIDLSQNTTFVDQYGFVYLRFISTIQTNSYSSARTAPYVYKIYSNETGPFTYFDYTSTQVDTLLPIHAVNQTISSIELNTSLDNNTYGKIGIFFSANGGVNWDRLNQTNTKHVFNFTTPGTQLKMRVTMNTSAENSTPILDRVDFFDLVGSDITEVGFDLGSDGTYDYNYTTLLNETNRDVNITSLRQVMSEYYNLNCDDVQSGCLIPIRMKSNAASWVNITQINFTTTPNNGPTASLVTLNITPVISSCNTNPCIIPINVSWTSGTSVSMSNLQLGYYGDGNITITARATNDSSINETWVAYVYYSNYNYTMPKNVYWLEFIPKTPTSKGVQPYGQSSTKPILNFTMMNNEKNISFWMLDNETSSCVTLYYSNNNTRIYSGFFDNLIADYPFDLDVRDVSGYDLDGTNTSTSWVEAHRGKGLSFDGAASYATLPNTYPLNISTENLTISVWVRRLENNVSQMIVSKNDNNIALGTGGYYLQFDSSNRPLFRVGDFGSSNSRTATGTAIDDNGWHNLVAVWHATKDINLYVDGVNSTTKSGQQPGNIDNIRNALSTTLGRQSSDVGTYFNGTIDEVRVWTRVMTLAEASSYYNKSSQYHYDDVLNDEWKLGLWNKASESKQGVWMWADYNCNSTNWALFNPEMYMRGCAIDSICSEELT